MINWREYDKFIENSYKPPKLTPLQKRILYSLHTKEVATNANLSEYLKSRPSDISRNLEILVYRGLVYKEQIKRGTLAKYSLTDDGEKYLKELEEESLNANGG